MPCTQLCSMHTESIRPEGRWSNTTRVWKRELAGRRRTVVRTHEAPTMVLPPFAEAALLL